MDAEYKADLVISTLEEFKAFRDAVNGGDTFAGKTVLLTADIDLGNEEWTPIGNSTTAFKGTFNGGEHTISNLKITRALENAAGNNKIGLFGVTNSPAAIKNLTINNVDITGSLYVGALVGSAYTGSEISNCHVTGDITIDGWWYVGGIAGFGYMQKVENCTVKGNDGSYIKGHEGSYISGIMGQRGEGGMSITNCSVENIAISGVDRTGGICGIAQYGNTIENCTVKDCTIEASNQIGSTALIVGANNGTVENGVSTLLNNNAENTTVTIAGTQLENPALSGTRHDGSEVQASIVGDVTYDENGKIVSGTVNVLGTGAGDIDVATELGLDTATTGAYKSEDGSFTINAVSDARIGDVFYETFQEAADASVNGDTIQLLKNETPVAVGGAVFNDGESVTITTNGEEVAVDWSTGYFFIGRGGNSNAEIGTVSTVTFDNAKISSAKYKADEVGATGYGFNISGATTDDDKKNNGVLNIKNSEIVVDYLKSQGTVNVTGNGSYEDGAVDLTVIGYFGFGGRTAGEAGEDKTSTFNLTNGAYVVVNNENGAGVAGLSDEAYGILNITDSKFVIKSAAKIGSMGTVNVVDGVYEATTLTNNGVICAAGNSEITAERIIGGGAIYVGGINHTTPFGKNESTVLEYNVNTSGNRFYIGTDALEDEGVTHTLKITGTDTDEVENEAFTAGYIYNRHSGVLSIENADVTTAGITSYGKIEVKDGMLSGSDHEIALIGRAEKNATGKAVITLDNSKLVTASNSSAGHIQLGEWGGNYGTAELILKNGSSVEANKLYMTKHETVTGNVSITMDATSSLKANTLVYNGGEIIIDAAGFTAGTKTIIDLSGTESLENMVTVNNKADGINVIYRADGDVMLTDQSLDTLYVSSSWTDADNDGIVDGKGYVIGFNAFSTVKEAFAMAQSVGGATIDLGTEGYEYARALGDGNEIPLTSAGTYTITGGNGVLLNYEVEVNPEKADGKYVLNAEDAYITAIKLTLRYNAEMSVTNSRIDYNAELDDGTNGTYGGHSYFSVYNNSKLTVTNSQIGYNPRQTGVEEPGQPATEGVGSNRWAFGPTWQIYGTADFTGSKLYAWVGQGNGTGFDVSGAGNATLTGSQLYTGILNVGYQFNRKYYDYTKENDATFTPNGLNSTLTLDNTIVMQTQYGNAFNVGSTTYETYTGKLVIKNKSEVDFTVRNFGTGLQIGNAGSSVEISDSTLKVVSVTNNGTITIDATSVIEFNSVWQNTGTITVDMTGAAESLCKVVDYTGTGTVAGYGNVVITGAEGFNAIVFDNDLYVGSVDMSSIMVNAAWSSAKTGDLVYTDGEGKKYYFGFNAFAEFNSVLAAAEKNNADTTVTLLSDVAFDLPTDLHVTLGGNLLIQAADPAQGAVINTIQPASNDMGISFAGPDQSIVSIGQGVTWEGVCQYFPHYSAAGGVRPQTTIAGTLDTTQYWNMYADTVISESGKLVLAGDAFLKLRRDSNMTVTGSVTDVSAELDTMTKSIDGGYISIDLPGERTLNINNAYVDSYWIDGSGATGSFAMALNNSVLKLYNDGSGRINFAGSELAVTLDFVNSRVICGAISGNATTAITIDNSTVTATSVANAGTVSITGNSTVNAVFSGSGLNLITGDASLKGSVKTNDVNTDITLADGNIVLDGTVIEALGYVESAYSEVIVGGGCNNNAATVVTMQNGAQVTAQRVWVGGEYDKEPAGTKLQQLVVKGEGTLLNAFEQVGLNVRRDGYLYVTDGAVVKSSDTVLRGVVEVDNGASFSGNGGSLYGESGGAVAVLTVTDASFEIVEGQVFTIGHASTADRQGKLDLNGKATATFADLNLTAQGSIELDWASTLSFAKLTAAANTITVNMTGFDGETKTLIDYTGSDTAALDKAYYMNLLGSSWNETYFKVENGDLLLDAAGKTTTVYVNSDWADTQVGEKIELENGTILTFGTDAFASCETAKEVDPLEIITLGGTVSEHQGLDGISGTIHGGTHTGFIYGGNAQSDATVAANSELTIHDGEFKRVIGGNLVTANRTFVDVNGKTTLNVNGGTFSSVFCAGDHVKNGVVTRTGSTTLNITGGTFNNHVAGGAVLELGKNFSGFAAVATGDININISGGSFVKRLYGGHLSGVTAHAAYTQVNGDINITIDATANKVTFGNNIDIVAGSSGQGTVNGNVSVTLKASGENFSFNGYLSGGSESAVYRVGDNGERTPESYVTGTGSLTFDNYVAAFNGKIFMFSDIDFVNNSQVDFTNSTRSLADISDWDFEAGSSLTGVNLNDFTNDTLDFDLTGWDQSEWTVMSGSSAAFTGLESASVTLGGQVATTWDADLAAWCSNDYKLTLSDDGDNKKLVLTLA